MGSSQKANLLSAVLLPVPFFSRTWRDRKIVSASDAAKVVLLAPGWHASGIIYLDNKGVPRRHVGVSEGLEFLSASDVRLAAGECLTGSVVMWIACASVPGWDAIRSLARLVRDLENRDRLPVLDVLLLVKHWGPVSVVAMDATPLPRLQGYVERSAKERLRDLVFGS